MTHCTIIKLKQDIYLSTNFTEKVIAEVKLIFWKRCLSNCSLMRFHSFTLALCTSREYKLKFTLNVNTKMPTISLKWSQQPIKSVYFWKYGFTRNKKCVLIFKIFKYFFYTISKISMKLLFF